MELYMILIGVFVVGFLSSLLGSYVGDRWFGEETGITMSMTFNVDSNDIDVDKIAKEIAEEFEKTQKYIE